MCLLKLLLLLELWVTISVVSADKLQCFCGVKPKSRVLGGSEMGKYTHPWMVQILVHMPNRHGRNISRLCGGALITSEHVLTAAHCQYPDSYSHDLFIGGHKQQDPMAIRRKVNLFYIHPKYDPIHKTNNIAIIFLSYPVGFDGKLTAPICLPPNGDAFYRDIWMVQVMGWGVVDYNGPWPKAIHETVMRTMTFDDCRKATAISVIEPQGIEMCAYIPGRSICYGDGGGPAVYYDVATSQHYVVGINTRSLCVTELPSIFTKVGPYVDWIKPLIRQGDMCSLNYN